MSHAQNIINQYKNLMETLQEENTCKIFTCDKERTKGYPCCSWEDSNYLHTVLNNLDDLFTAKENMGENNRREDYTIGELEYYGNLKV